MENVPEFVTWGPIGPDNKPIKERAGETFQRFIGQLRALGYEVEWNVLAACDYGAPTSRARFVLIARCDGLPIVWPEPTHGRPGLPPWRPASEIIDWTLPLPSIFSTREEIWQQYGIRAQRPLQEKTMERIARGIKKFVIDSPDPFIVPESAPFMIQYHGLQSTNDVRGQRLDQPLMTVDTANRYGLVATYITKLKGTNIGQSMHDPLQTITAGGLHFGKVCAFILKYYGSNIGHSLNDPLQTITSRDRFGLVVIHGEPYQIYDIGLRMLTPRELYNGQGFAKDYIIDHGADGQIIKRGEQVAKVGNSVSPPMACALVRANLPDMCIKEVA
jgi:DNA (cytosine-5)-methyltransferase 1